MLHSKIANKLRVRGFICEIKASENRTLALSITLWTNPVFSQQGNNQKSLLDTLEAASARAASLARTTEDSYLPSAGDEDHFPVFTTKTAESTIQLETAPCAGNASAFLVNFRIDQMRYSQIAKAIEGIANITRTYGNMTDSAGNGVIFSSPLGKESAEWIWLGGWNMQYLPAGGRTLPRTNYTEFLEVSCLEFPHQTGQHRPSETGGNFAAA